MSIISYSIPILKKLRWLALMIGLIGFAIGFASQSLSDARNTSKIALSNSDERTVPASAQQHTFLESEIITATRRGFEPALITRTEGKFILMVDNRSGRDLNFRLSRDTGQPLNEIATSRQELEWNEVLDLRAGRYVLTERNHPEWGCVIRITAR
jgi:hypothetical protein